MLQKDFERCLIAGENQEMGKLLHRLGLFFFRNKWWVVGLWAVVLVTLGGTMALFFKPASNAISIPGTEAQVAIDRLGQLFPEAGKGSGRIVYHTTDKPVSDFKSAIEANLDQVKQVEGVVNVVSPFVNTAAISSDGKTAYAQVQLRDEAGQIDVKSLNQIAGITNSISSPELQVERGGNLINIGVGEIIGVTELIGIGIALLVLILTFGALVSAGMPLLIAVVAVGVSITGLFSLSQVININSTTPALSFMLGMAVGIDYSLFITSKYRSLLLEGYSYTEAAGRAIGTAGNAVIFAASTVIIALSALSVVNIPFMTTMGIAGAASIAVAAIVAISLTPALFGIFGQKLFSRNLRQKIAIAQEQGPVGKHGVLHSSIWHKWAQALIKRPLIAILFSAVIVGLLAFPVGSLTLGLPTDQFAASSTTQKKAYNLLTSAFGEGYNAPLIVLASNVPAVTEADRALVRTALTNAYQKQVDAQTAALKDKFEKQAAAATTPELKAQLQQDIAKAMADGQQQQQAAQAQLEAQITQYSSLFELNKIATELAKSADVKSATPASITRDGNSGIIWVIPNSAPSSQQTSDLISYIRNNQAKASGNPQVTLAVTGSTALQDDINKKLADALPVYLVVVVGLSLLLLLIAFKSILIPIKATFGFLLSVAAMFGSIVAVFQWGWLGLADPAPIVSFIPIIGIGILFGLAMDYEFFLVSSIHEAYTKTNDPKRAIELGFSLGSKVVTAAAAIMVSVFAGFMGNHDTNIKSIGFGLAIGIFVDAFIVRMTFVPAVMTLLGRSAWWIPRWLKKVLPPLSIEGEIDEASIEEVEAEEVVTLTKS
jgi:RND superfamily putative drug exporter